MRRISFIKTTFIIILLIILGVVIKNFNNETNYVIFNYQIESISEIDTGLCFTFIDDETLEQKENEVNNLYVVYKSRVDLDVLNGIKVGDYVTITVEDNYGSAKYTIIYEMKYNDNSLFNIRDYYENLGRNNKTIFMSLLISLIIYLVVISICSFEKIDINKIYINKSPMALKELFIGVIIGSSALILAYNILFILGKCDIDYYLFSVIFYIFLAIGVFSLYALCKEKIVFENKEITYYKVFGKNVVVKLQDIMSVVITTYNQSNLTDIEIYNYNYKCILKYSETNRLKEENVLVKLCQKYEIDVKIFDIQDYLNKEPYRRYDVNKFIKNINILNQYNAAGEIWITTRIGKQYLLVCYKDYIDFSNYTDSIDIKININDISKYIDFMKELRIDGPVDFNIPLEKQLEIIDGKIWFNAKKKPWKI